MGKGKIVSVTGDGEFIVSIEIDLVRYTAQKDKIDAQIIEQQVASVSAQAAYAAAQAESDAAWSALDVAIAQYNADPTDANKKNVDSKQQQAWASQTSANNVKYQWQRIDYTILSLEKRLENLTSVVPLDILNDYDPEQAVAWSADYNLDYPVGAEVGLIDIGRQAGKIQPTQVIMPGGVSGNDSAYDKDRDGVLQSYVHADPNAAFYNTAILPGADKWKPRYRKGTVVSVDSGADTAVVDIDALVVTSQTLDVNQTTQVTAEVVYMSCNAAAFDVGDRVVIAFTESDWSKPKLIGFESNPVACIANLAFLYEYNTQGAKAFSQAWISELGSRYFDVKSNYYQFQYFDTNKALLPIYGQWLNGKHYTARACIFSATSPQQAIIVQEDATFFATIADLSASIPSPYGYTNGACCNSGGVIVFARYKGVLPSTEVNVNEIIFYSFDGSVLKTVPNTFVTDPNTINAKANEHGIIIDESYSVPPTVRRARILDLDGVTLFAGSDIGTKLADVAATKSYFIAAEVEAGVGQTFKTYDKDGNSVGSMFVSEEAATTDRPLGLEGEPVWFTNIKFTADDDVLSIVYQWGWNDNDKTPPSGGYTSLVQVFQYNMTDGDTLTFKESSDPVLYDHMLILTNATNKV